MSNDIVIRRFPCYSSDLGNLLIPGEDFFSVQLRSDLGELILCVRQSPGYHGFFIHHLITKLQSGSFSPLRVAVEASNPTWSTSKVVEQWAMDSVKLINILSQYICDHQRLGKRDLHAFLNQLQALSVSLDGKNGFSELAAMLEQTYDWRAAFIACVTLGRSSGFSFSRNVKKKSGEQELIRKINLLMLTYQFQLADASYFIANCVPTYSEPFWQQLFRRRLSF